MPISLGFLEWGCPYHFDSLSRESGTDFWRLSDIPAKSGMVGKKLNPPSSGILRHMKTRLSVFPRIIARAIISFFTSIAGDYSREGDCSRETIISNIVLWKSSP